MPQVIIYASDITCVRNGFTGQAPDFAVGGPATGTNYNNTSLMTFPSFGLPAGSVITAAVLSWELIGADWSASSTIYVAACGAYSPSSVNGINQPDKTSGDDGTSVSTAKGVKIMTATKAAVQMLTSGVRALKLWQPNGNNRKNFKGSGAYLTITYTPPGSPGSPQNVNLSVSPFETALRVSWAKGSGGTNNPITGHEVRYQTSSNGYTWGTETVVPLNAAATYYDIPAAVISALARGHYIRTRVGSKSDYAATVYSGYAQSRKNRMPNTPTSPTVPQTSYIPGDVIRVSFANTGDPDGNLSGFEVATDQSTAIVGSQAGASVTYVDVPTAGWEQGIQRRFRVRGYDAFGVRGAWSAYTATVTLNATPLLPEISYPAAGSTVYRQRPHILLKAAATNDGPKHILCVTEGGSEKTTVDGAGFSSGANDDLSSGRQVVYQPQADLASGVNNISTRMYDSFLYSAAVSRSFAVAAFTPADPELTAAGMKIKAAQITELQTAVSNLRTAYGLAAPSWTACVAGTTLISTAAALITQLQTALQAVIDRINGWDTANTTFDISVTWINPTAAGGGVDRVKLRQAIEQLRSVITQI